MLLSNWCHKEARKKKKDAPYLDSSIKHICSPRIVPTVVFNFLCKGVIKIVAGYIIKATLKRRRPDMARSCCCLWIVFANFLARRTIMPWWITLITIPSYAFIHRERRLWRLPTVKLVLYQDVVRCHNFLLAISISRIPFRTAYSLVLLNIVVFARRCRANNLWISRSLHSNWNDSCFGNDIFLQSMICTPHEWIFHF